MHQASGFLPQLVSRTHHSAPQKTTTPQDFLSPPMITRGSRVWKAGFGGGDPKKKKEQKLKPKAQWDRYTDALKKETPYRVAVKAVGKGSEDWLEVGNIKSKGGDYTKAAVARQRALIAEVRRWNCSTSYQD